MAQNLRLRRYTWFSYAYELDKADPDPARIKFDPSTESKKKSRTGKPKKRAR